MVRWLAPCWLLALAGLGLAQEAAEPISDPQNVADVLSELDAAGTPATSAEIAAFLAAAPSTATGYWLARLSWRTSEPLGKSTRLRWAKGPVAVRAKWRQGHDGLRASGAAARFHFGKLSLGVGQLGMAQGFGLIAAGPGRGPSLTADGSLGKGSRGLVMWGGEAEAQTILGASLTWESNRWQARILAGQRAVSFHDLPHSSSATLLWQGAITGPQWQVALLGLLDPQEKGLSFAGRWRRKVADGSWEVVWREPAGSVRPMMAWLGQVGWRPAASLYVESLLGWADAGPRPVLGQKHPVLAGWSGQGVAVRGTWRPAVGLGIKVLVHRGQTVAVAADRRDHKTLLDLQLSQRWTGGWQLAGRWRRGGGDVLMFSERFPWQPAALAWQDARQVVSIKGSWQGQGNRASLIWRRLNISRVRQDSGWESGGARSLLAFSAGVSVAQTGLLRLGWAWSWGDPVDLVSAVVPFGGYVLPRHWGHWRSEVLLGLECPWHSFDLKTAISRRSPETSFSGSETGVPDAWAAWCEVVWHW